MVKKAELEMPAKNQKAAVQIWGMMLKQLYKSPEWPEPALDQSTVISTTKHYL